MIAAAASDSFTQDAHFDLLSITVPKSLSLLVTTISDPVSIYVKSGLIYLLQCLLFHMCLC